MSWLQIISASKQHGIKHKSVQPGKNKSGWGEFMDHLENIIQINGLIIYAQKWHLDNDQETVVRIF